jgi:hypothetical protein
MENITIQQGNTYIVSITKAFMTPKIHKISVEEITDSSIFIKYVDEDGRKERFSKYLFEVLVTVVEELTEKPVIQPEIPNPPKYKVVHYIPGAFMGNDYLPHKLIVVDRLSDNERFHIRKKTNFGYIKSMDFGDNEKIISVSLCSDRDLINPCDNRELSGLIPEPEITPDKVNITSPLKSNLLNTSFIHFQIISYYFDGGIYSFSEKTGYYYNEKNNKTLLFKDTSSIYSVKRISGSQIFTLNHYNTELLGVVESITRDVNTNTVTVHYNKVGQKIDQPEESPNKQETPEVLLTTHDKVNITNPKQILYSVCPRGAWETKELTYERMNWGKLGRPETYQKGFKRWIHFANKAMMDEYIHENKPCLSLEDIMKMDYSVNGNCVAVKTQDLFILVNEKIKLGNYISIHPEKK